MCKVARPQPAPPASTVELVGESVCWCPCSRRVTIFAGKGYECDLYGVEAFPCDGGVGVTFSKRTPGTDAEETDGYTVFLSAHAGEYGRQCDTCECRGYLRWNKPCKHIRAARDLHEAGKLFAGNPLEDFPEEPAYSDDEIDTMYADWLDRFPESAAV